MRSQFAFKEKGEAVKIDIRRCGICRSVIWIEFEDSKIMGDEEAEVINRHLKWHDEVKQ